LHSLRSFLDGCALLGLHSLRSFLDGCALLGLHSLRSFLDGCALLGLHSLRSLPELRWNIRVRSTDEQPSSIFKGDAAAVCAIRSVLRAVTFDDDLRSELE